MRIVTCALVVSSLVIACGKKSDPVAVGDAATTTAPKPEAPKPEAPKPEAPKPEAPKPEEPKPEEPRATLSPYWAPLFEKGRESTWNVTETVVASEGDEPGKLKTTTKELAGKLTCKVDDVKAAEATTPGADKPEAITLSTITCTGYSFEHGVEEGPMGTWGTNGKLLWKRIGELDEPRLDAVPEPRSIKDEEIEVDVARRDDGTWCWKMGIIIGDGGVLEACFDATRGPVRFFGHGGSAAVDSKVTVTLAP